MSFLAPYMVTSQKEDGTNPQGSEEQGEELFHLKCHSLPQRRVELHLTHGLNPN